MTIPELAEWADRKSQIFHRGETADNLKAIARILEALTENEIRVIETRLARKT